MRALLAAAFLLLAVVAVAPGLADAQPTPPCGDVTFDPETGDGTFGCGPFGCWFGVHDVLRCVG